MEMAGRSLKGQQGQRQPPGRPLPGARGGGGDLLKDMQGGGQEELDSDKVVHAALRGLHELA